jgi:hypothetical protein
MVDFHKSVDVDAARRFQRHTRVRVRWAWPGLDISMIAGEVGDQISRSRKKKLFSVSALTRCCLEDASWMQLIHPVPVTLAHLINPELIRRGLGLACTDTSAEPWRPRLVLDGFSTKSLSLLFGDDCF